MKTLQDQKLDGHNLELKFSNRTFTGSSAGAARKPALNQQNKTKSSKILVRNIPFEAKAKEIEELFQVFGALKYVRLPKKIDGAHRGFGFVDYVTVNEAERAFDALHHSAHLFGRRLVLEWAEPEQSQDVEILRQKEELLSGKVGWFDLTGRGLNLIAVFFLPCRSCCQAIKEIKDSGRSGWKGSFRY